MDAFANLSHTIAELKEALAVRGDERAVALARARAEALAAQLGPMLEVAEALARNELAVAVARAAHERSAVSDASHTAFEVTLRGERLRAEVAESQRKTLEQQLAKLRSTSVSRVEALEEEVEALLSPLRGEVAKSLYEARRQSLTAEIEAAKAQRERLEVLLKPSGTVMSEIECARDASLIDAALERETELAERLAETQAR
ncbi:MAG: hypothetical protein HOV80_19060, partial [Polyangiaceae bacterium]|nr:hypothetical protein [Polyangiaceae bacterium]